MNNQTTLLKDLLVRDHRQKYETFCQAYDETARTLGGHLRGTQPSRTQYYRWLSGQLKGGLPYPDACRVLEAMFPGWSAEQLLNPHNSTATPTSKTPLDISLDEPRANRGAVAQRNPRRTTDHSSFADPPRSSEETFGSPHRLRTRPADGTDKRELERQVAMAARRAFHFSANAEGTNMGPETLAQLREEVQRLAIAYQVEAFPSVLADLTEIQEATFRLLEGRQRPADTRDLYFLAAAASGMMANASHDLGDNHSAMAQARAAYVCADNADHDGLRTWVRGLQSMIAYWAGWPQKAVKYAESGAESASRVTGTATVWLPALEARAWAVLGNADKVWASINSANAARDEVSPNELDELGGKLTFPLPRQLYYAADAIIWLPGEEEQAESMASAALLAYEDVPRLERSYVDETVARTDLAIARARRGELEGARQALEAVLDLRPAERIGGIVVNAHRVHRELSRPTYRTSAAAIELQDEIEEFCQVTAASALRR